MVALRRGKECEGWWGQCRKLGGHNQRSMRDVEAELSSKKKARVSGCADFPGHIKDSLLAYFLFFRKTCNIYDTPTPVPSRQLPSSACREFLLPGAELGRAPGLTRVFLLPGSSGHGAEETGPFLSARSTEISKHFLSQTELQRRKLGKAWELCFCLTRKSCSGNI